MRAAFGRWVPVLPVVALVAALGVPSGDHGAGGSALPGPGSAGVLGAAGGDGGTMADAVSAVVVLCAAVRALCLTNRPLTRTAAVILGLPVLGFAVAATGAPDASAGLAGFVRYLQVFVLVPAAVLLLVRGRAQMHLVAWAFIALALWEGGLGVFQYATGTGASYMGSDIRAVGTFGPGDVMGMATTVAYGLVCAVGLALGGRAAGRRSALRACGNPVAGSGPTGSRSAGSRLAERLERAAALLCAVLLVLPLAVSFSRGAWIATAVACGAQLALTGLRRAVTVGAALAAALVVLAGGVGVGSSMLEQRLSSITHVTDTPDQSVVDRYTMWSAALGMWREHPVTGVGMKGFPAYRDSHASLALSSGSDTEGAGAGFRRQPLLSPHNMYLLVLGEQGLLGLMGLAAGWAALLVCGLGRAAAARRLASTPPRGSPAAGRAGAAECGLVACGLLVWQLVDFVYADIGGPSTVLTAVVLGLAAWWAVGAEDGAERAEAVGTPGAPRTSDAPSGPRTSGAPGVPGASPQATGLPAPAAPTVPGRGPRETTGARGRGAGR